MQMYRETEVIQMIRSAALRGWRSGLGCGLAGKALDHDDLLAMENTIIDSLRAEGALRGEVSDAA